MSFLDALPDKYRVILCDIWGVIHDGVSSYPGAAERLLQWASEGRRIILITNAPRTADAVEQQLAGIGLPRGAWHHISTSGEAGIAALTVLPLFNIPEAGLLLILAVDHFLDMGRSATNVIGNAVASVAVAKWEGTLDSELSPDIAGSRAPSHQPPLAPESEFRP